MKISPDMVDYIRTMVNRNDEENDRVGQRLNEAGWGDFAALLGAVFILAVERRCGDSIDAAGAMNLVAEMRATAPVPPDYIDANAAEIVLRSALDPDIDHDVEPAMVGRIQGLVIMHVLGSPTVTDEERESVYAEARQMVSRI
nr:hypothetical protein [Micromonospora sp. DSM 115978]